MLKFITANSSNTHAIAKLVNSAYRGDHAKKGWTTEAYILDGQRTDPNSLNELISTPQNFFEVAFDDKDTSQAIACVHLVVEGPTILYFGMLTVEPNLQASGLGKETLKHVEMFAEKKNLKCIRMTVIDSRTELMAYYERRGYQKTGRTHPFPTDAEKFGHPKIPIVLVEFEKLLS